MSISEWINNNKSLKFVIKIFNDFKEIKLTKNPSIEYFYINETIDEDCKNFTIKCSWLSTHNNEPNLKQKNIIAKIIVESLNNNYEKIIDRAIDIAKEKLYFLAESAKDEIEEINNTVKEQ